MIRASVFNKDIDHFIRDAKRDKGMTHAKLARKIGCSASLLSRRVSEKRLPYLPFWYVAQIADAADMEIIFKQKER